MKLHCGVLRPAVAGLLMEKELRYLGQPYRVSLSPQTHPAYDVLSAQAAAPES